MSIDIFATQLLDFEAVRVAMEAQQARWPKCSCGAPANPSTGPRCDACEEVRRRAIEIIGRANIPARYAWASFESPDLAKRVTNAEAIERASRWDASDRCVFAGPQAGSGKTSLAVATAKRAVFANPKIVSLLFVDAISLSMARGQFGAIADLVTRAKEASLVVIDDVGAEGKDPHRSIASTVFERYQRCRPTIVTTGLSKLALDELYGAAIERRLIEHAFIVNCATAIKAAKPAA